MVDYKKKAIKYKNKYLNLIKNKYLNLIKNKNNNIIGGSDSEEDDLEQDPHTESPYKHKTREQLFNVDGFDNDFYKEINVNDFADLLFNEQEFIEKSAKIAPPSADWAHDQIVVDNNLNINIHASNIVDAPKMSSEAEYLLNYVKDFDVKLYYINKNWDWEEFPLSGNKCIMDYTDSCQNYNNNNQNIYLPEEFKNHFYRFDMGAKDIVRKTTSWENSLDSSSTGNRIQELARSDLAPNLYNPFNFALGFIDNDTDKKQYLTDFFNAKWQQLLIFTWYLQVGNNTHNSTETSINKDDFLELWPKNESMKYDDFWGNFKYNFKINKHDESLKQIDFLKMFYIAINILRLMHIEIDESNWNNGKIFVNATFKKLSDLQKEYFQEFNHPFRIDESKYNEFVKKYGCSTRFIFPIDQSTARCGIMKGEIEKKLNVKGAARTVKDTKNIKNLNKLKTAIKEILRNFTLNIEQDKIEFYYGYVCMYIALLLKYTSGDTVYILGQLYDKLLRNHDSFVRSGDNFCLLRILLFKGKILGDAKAVLGKNLKFTLPEKHTYDTDQFRYFISVKHGTKYKDFKNNLQIYKGNLDKATILGIKGENLHTNFFNYIEFLKTEIQKLIENTNSLNDDDNIEENISIFESYKELKKYVYECNKVIEINNMIKDSEKLYTNVSIITTDNHYSDFIKNMDLDKDNIEEINNIFCLHNTNKDDIIFKKIEETGVMCQRCEEEVTKDKNYKFYVTNKLPPIDVNNKLILCINCLNEIVSLNLQQKGGVKLKFNEYFDVANIDLENLNSDMLKNYIKLINNFLEKLKEDENIKKSLQDLDLDLPLDKNILNEYIKEFGLDDFSLVGKNDYKKAGLQFLKIILENGIEKKKYKDDDEKLNKFIKKSLQDLKSIEKADVEQGAAEKSEIVKEKSEPIKIESVQVADSEPESYVEADLQYILEIIEASKEITLHNNIQLAQIYENEKEIKNRHSYLENMSEEGQWGGLPEILAYANMKQTNLVLVCKDDNKKYNIYLAVLNESWGFNNNINYLLHSGNNCSAIPHGNHFKAMIDNNFEQNLEKTKNWFENIQTKKDSEIEVVDLDLQEIECGAQGDCLFYSFAYFDTNIKNNKEAQRILRKKIVKYLTEDPKGKYIPTTNFDFNQTTNFHFLKNQSIENNSEDINLSDDIKDVVKNLLLKNKNKNKPQLNNDLQELFITPNLSRLVEYLITLLCYLYDYRLDMSLLYGTAESKNILAILLNSHFSIYDTKTTSHTNNLFLSAQEDKNNKTFIINFYNKIIELLTFFNKVYELAELEEIENDKYMTHKDKYIENIRQIYSIIKSLFKRKFIHNLEEYVKWGKKGGPKEMILSFSKPLQITTDNYESTHIYDFMLGIKHIFEMTIKTRDMGWLKYNDFYSIFENLKNNFDKFYENYLCIELQIGGDGYATRYQTKIENETIHNLKLINNIIEITVNDYINNKVKEIEESIDAEEYNKRNLGQNHYQLRAIENSINSFKDLIENSKSNLYIDLEDIILACYAEILPILNNDINRRYWQNLNEELDENDYITKYDEENLKRNDESKESIKEKNIYEFNLFLKSKLLDQIDQNFPIETLKKEIENFKLEIKIDYKKTIEEISGLIPDSDHDNKIKFNLRIRLFGKDIENSIDLMNCNNVISINKLKELNNKNIIMEELLNPKYNLEYEPINEELVKINYQLDELDYPVGYSVDNTLLELHYNFDKLESILNIENTEEFKDQLNGIFKCYTSYGNSSCDGKDNEFYNCWMAGYFENIFTILTKCTQKLKKTNLIKIFNRYFKIYFTYYYKSKYNIEDNIHELIYDRAVLYNTFIASLRIFTIEFIKLIYNDNVFALLKEKSDIVILVSQIKVRCNENLLIHNILNYNKEKMLNWFDVDDKSKKSKIKKN